MKLILFDIDGTLICSGGAGRRALDVAFAAVLGVEGAMAGISLAGMTDGLIFDRVFVRHGNAETLPPDADERVLEVYLEQLQRELADSTGYRVLPGVLKLVDVLSRDEAVALAIGTGNIEAGARLKLEHGALNHYFPCGGFGSDGHTRPEILSAGIRQAESYHQTRFDDVWVVGDTCHDVNAARAVGAMSLAVATGTESVEELERSNPDVIVETLEDSRAWTTLKPVGAIGA